MHHRMTIALALTIGLTLLGSAASAGFGFPKAGGLDVNDVLADPSGYTSEITVRGGVTIVDTEQKLFDIVDYREYRSCRTVDCGRKWISVLFEKDLPKKGDVVEVTGVIEKNDAGKGGYVLKATKVRVSER